MHTLCVAACVATLAVTSALAQELIGCDKFKWPVEKEMAALRAPKLEAVASGSKVSMIPFAGTVLLAPLNAANLPKAPERAPKNDTFAGYLSVAGTAAGPYSISLSDAAWVDVLQDNRFLKAKAHSGVQGCEAIRKVLQFDLTAEPFVVQISGAPSRQLTVAVMRTD